MTRQYDDSDDYAADALAEEREALAEIEAEDFGDAEVFWPDPEEE